MDFDQIKLLYEENSKVTHTFWEWRHKIMNRFFVAVSAIFISCGWLLNNNFKEYVFIPLFLGAIYSFISKKMDNVNTWILKACYDIGSQLEKEIGKENAIYSIIKNGYRKKGSYGKLLSFLYIMSGFVLIILSLISLIVYTL